MPPLVKAARAHDGASAACVKSKIAGFASEKLRPGGTKSVCRANAKSKTMAPFEYRIPRGRSARRISRHLRQLLTHAFLFLLRLPRPRRKRRLNLSLLKGEMDRACSHNYFYRGKKSKSGAGGMSSACQAGALAKAGDVPSINVLHGRDPFDSAQGRLLSPPLVGG